jgi:hypothetical protein
MKTENSDSEKDLNANPDSSLNTNKPLKKPNRFPESRPAKGAVSDADEAGEKDSDIELLAEDVAGSVGARETGSSPSDIAGVSDIDTGMRRAKRRR